MKRLVVFGTVLLFIGFLAGWLAQPRGASAKDGECQSEKHAEGQFCLDTDGSGFVNITDGIHVLNFLFLGDPPQGEQLNCACPAHEAPHLKAALAACQAELAQCQAELATCQSQLALRGPLPVTGQKKCYDDSDPAHEIPCDSADLPGQDGFYQAGCPTEGRWVDNGDGTMTDNCTGLMWQQQTSGGTFTWRQALQYCEDLTFAGHGDWRLPNVLELLSIVDYGQFGGLMYWSSTSVADFPSDAWGVGFGGGSVGDSGSSKGSRWSARAVRTPRPGE
jgi:hypothetical protein